MSIKKTTSSDIVGFLIAMYGPANVVHIVIPAGNLDAEVLTENFDKLCNFDTRLSS